MAKSVVYLLEVGAKLDMVDQSLAAKLLRQHPV